MTHIFIFNNASRAANYGVGSYVRSLSDGLLECTEMNVSFVDMFSDVKEYVITDDERGCRHYRIPALASRIENEQYCRNIFYFLAGHITLEAGNRLVFQFNYFLHMPLAVLLKGEYPDCRIIVSVHYLSWCFELKGNKKQFHKLTAQGYKPQGDKEKAILASVDSEKAFLHLADEVLVLSRDTRKILLEDYAISPDKLHLIYNGMGEVTCLEKDRKPDKTRTLLFVGRLDEIKGLEHLIDAFKQIAGKYRDTHLVIAGDGDFQRYLSLCRELHERVSFLGKVSSDEVEKLYRTAYIGVMPSFHEQCSYTAIEMMRHGIPLIGTDTTGLAEMFDATPELCVSIDEDKSDKEEIAIGIASRMDLLLSDKEVYDRAATAVARLYETRYKASTMIRGTCMAIEYSFNRQDYNVSPDYLKHIDYRMIQLINRCPDIDTDFYGIGGIGVYLWKRTLDLCKGKEKNYHTSLIQEHLIYYLDWLQDVVTDSQLPNESLAMLQSMKQKGFYKTCVQSLLELQQSSNELQHQMPSDKAIIRNALKICNCKI